MERLRDESAAVKRTAPTRQALAFDVMVNSWPDPAELCRRFEGLGVDGAWVTETAFDPFMSLVQASHATTSLRLGTGIAVAFARSPMTTAVSASQLSRISSGRFVLGLGTQVKAHITRRFSMPWSQPVSRMREYVAALRAIWDAWQTGAPLTFKGDFYEHTLMAPHFDPGPWRTVRRRSTSPPSGNG